MRFTIFVTKLNLDSVMYHAIRSYNDHELPRESDEEDRIASTTSAGEFLDRIVVDWILGALTRHTEIPSYYQTTAGMGELYRQRLDAVRSHYPDYAAECHRRQRLRQS